MARTFHVCAPGMHSIIVDPHVAPHWKILAMESPGIIGLEEAEGRGCGARTQWRGCVSRGNQGTRAARFVKGGRSLSGCALQRQSLCAALSRGVGATEGAGAARRDRL